MSWKLPTDEIHEDPSEKKEKPEPRERAPRKQQPTMNIPTMIQILFRVSKASANWNRTDLGKLALIELKKLDIELYNLAVEDLEKKGITVS